MDDQMPVLDPATSSGVQDHNRCDGESSSSVDTDHTDVDTVDAAGDTAAIDGDTTSNDEPGDTASELGSGSGSWMFDTMAGAWSFVPLTQQAAQIALDAVRYRRNYARSVTTRICLHYINTIRARVSSGVTNFLISVDGCESSQVEPTGRCDIWYCRPYTYELQLTQKAAGSDVFTVQSIFKTVDQKSLDELREDSNLDFATAPDAVAGTGGDSVIKQADTPVETEQPVVRQYADDDWLQGSSFMDSEQPIAWTSDVNTFGETQATASQQVTAEPLSLRAEPVSVSNSETETAPAIGSGTPGSAAVAIIGIATVSVSTIAFVAAFAMGRWRARARANAAKLASNQEYSPLRGTLNTAENTISMTSRDSLGIADAKADVDKVEYFS
ncbi:unnamed protein product [Phytophthora lilii]|uniref:Unnamed protein product n=1 Tax=Phytophthora lilii TaxID=2077276 RepID=A0A9W6TVC0_9STRA|nr:unnamed protein product [Phytophthora lilii]